MKAGADPIDWQDIRLVCGEGKLTADDVYIAVEIILLQRREREPQSAQQGELGPSSQAMFQPDSQSKP